MVYEKIKEFIVKARISRSTLYRFYKKNDEFWQETKLKNNKRMIPCNHTKYFDNEALFDELKIVKLENKSLRHLITCLAEKDTLSKIFWEMEWSFFVTVAYRAERNKKSCFRIMHQLQDEMNEKFGDDNKIRMFFVTEPFTNRKGYHNHFVLYIENKRLEPQVCDYIRKFFEYDRIDVSAYDMYQAGLFYMAKEGLQGEDWDILKN